MIEGCKPVCIMDTDSLLFSFKLNCPPKWAIDRINQQFDLFFPYKVFEEYKNDFAEGRLSAYDDVRLDIDLFFKRKMNNDRVITQEVYSNCLKFVKRWFNLKGKQLEYSNLGEGEKHCVALGLHLSRIKKEGLIVMTDDFRAINAGFDRFVIKQRVGLIHSLLGIMLFIYFVNRDISSSGILGIVNDYFHINQAKHYDFEQFKQEILEDLKHSCREQNFYNCGLSCLIDEDS